MSCYTSCPLKEAGFPRLLMAQCRKVLIDGWWLLYRLATGGSFNLLRRPLLSLYIQLCITDPQKQETIKKLLLRTKLKILSKMSYQLFRLSRRALLPSCHSTTSYYWPIAVWKNLQTYKSFKDISKFVRQEMLHLQVWCHGWFTLARRPLSAQLHITDPSCKNITARHGKLTWKSS